MAIPVRAPKFCILGGGITGLSCAYFLQNGFINIPSENITLVEKSNRLGGWIKTVNYGSFQFEVGPRYFQLGLTGGELLGLIKRLQLQQEIVLADKQSASLRYYLINKRVKPIPSRRDIIQYLPGIFKELLVKPNVDVNREDESIYNFSLRHVGNKISNEICDPAVFNTFVGDIRDLSMRSCFPLAWNIDKVYGSIILGGYKTNGSKSRIKMKTQSWLTTNMYDPLRQTIKFKSKDLYSLKAGCQTLVQALERHLLYPQNPYKCVNILKSSTAKRIIQHSEDTLLEDKPRLHVEMTDGRCIEADCVIAAIPAFELAAILSNSLFHTTGVSSYTSDGSMRRSAKVFCDTLQSIPYSSAVSVNVGYSGGVMKRKHRGSGYYCKAHESNDIIGMTWDSNLFPTVTTNLTRIGGLVGGPINPVTSLLDAENRFLRAIENHLTLSQKPDIVISEFCNSSFPQYKIGHSTLLNTLNSIRLDSLPWLQLVGSPYNGTLVSECILDARLLCDQIIKRYAYFPFLPNEDGSDWQSRGSDRYYS